MVAGTQLVVTVGVCTCLMLWSLASSYTSCLIKSNSHELLPVALLLLLLTLQWVRPGPSIPTPVPVGACVCCQGALYGPSRVLCQVPLHTIGQLCVIVRGPFAYMLVPVGDSVHVTCVTPLAPTGLLDM